MPSKRSDGGSGVTGTKSYEKIVQHSAASLPTPELHGAAVSANSGVPTGSVGGVDGMGENIGAGVFVTLPGSTGCGETNKPKFLSENELIMESGAATLLSLIHI